MRDHPSTKSFDFFPRKIEKDWEIFWVFNKYFTVHTILHKQMLTYDKYWFNIFLFSGEIVIICLLSALSFIVWLQIQKSEVYINFKVFYEKHYYFKFLYKFYNKIISLTSAVKRLRKSKKKYLFVTLYISYPPKVWREEMGPFKFTFVKKLISAESLELCCLNIFWWNIRVMYRTYQAAKELTNLH